MYPYGEVTWPVYRLKSPATQLFLQADIKKTFIICTGDIQDEMSKCMLSLGGY